MTYSSRVMIHAEGAYAVVSWGNGAAYDFHRGGQSVFLQGDDATAFRKALERAACAS